MCIDETSLHALGDQLLTAKVVRDTLHRKRDRTVKTGTCLRLEDNGGPHPPAWNYRQTLNIAKKVCSGCRYFAEEGSLGRYGCGPPSFDPTVLDQLVPYAGIFDEASHSSL
jgi:hypothetical protein